MLLARARRRGAVRRRGAAATAGAPVGHRDHAGTTGRAHRPALETSVPKPSHLRDGGRTSRRAGLRRACRRTYGAGPSGLRPAGAAEAGSTASRRDVHFHEVGAIDAVVDVVGTCAALRALGAGRLGACPVTVGGGRTSAAHGWLPVPAPAILELLREAGSWCRGVRSTARCARRPVPPAGGVGAARGPCPRCASTGGGRRRQPRPRRGAERRTAGRRAPSSTPPTPA